MQENLTLVVGLRRYLKVIDASIGEVKTAQLFVAVLGASSFTFAEATWTALPAARQSRVECSFDRNRARSPVLNQNLTLPGVGCTPRATTAAYSYSRAFLRAHLKRRKSQRKNLGKCPA
jgi:hypothetical protein